MGTIAKVECDACPVAFEGAVGSGMLGYSYTVVACNDCKDVVQASGYLGAWSDGTVPVEELVPVPATSMDVPEVLVCPTCKHEARTLWPESHDDDVDEVTVEPAPDLGPCPRCSEGRLHEVPGDLGFMLWD
jgi:hypothetical protein